MFLSAHTETDLPGIVSLGSEKITIQNKKDNSEDTSFKATLHDSDVLSCILQGSLDEFRDVPIEKIKRCLKLEDDGQTVVGRETEIYSTKGDKIVTDSVFDVKIPDSNLSLTDIHYFSVILPCLYIRSADIWLFCPLSQGQGWLVHPVGVEEI